MILEFQLTLEELHELEDVQVEISTRKLYSRPMRSALFLLHAVSVVLVLLIVVFSIYVGRFPPHPAAIVLLAVTLGIAYLSRRILRRSLINDPPGVPSGFINPKPRKQTSTPRSKPWMLVFLPIGLALLIITLSDVRVIDPSAPPSAAPPPRLREVVWKELVKTPPLYMLPTGAILALSANYVARRLRKKTTDQSRRAEAAADRIIFKNGDDICEVPWSALAGFVETPRLMIIYARDLPYQPVPKRAFDPPDLLVFRDLLRDSASHARAGSASAES